MNIPVGTIVERHLSFEDVQPLKKIGELLAKGFNGYMAATVEGVSGLEEVILFAKGKQVVGAIFDSLRLDKQVYGTAGLKLCLNLLKAKKGVFDVNKLSQQQINLIMAFNERIRLQKPVDAGTLSKLAPPFYRKEIVSKQLAFDLHAKQSRYNVLRKFGLGSI